MSTTRFWGEPDDGDKVRRAQGRPLYEMGGKYFGVILGEMDGRRVQSAGVLFQFSVNKPSYGVNGNEYHAVLG